VLATAGFAGAIRRLARPWAVGLALFALVPLGPALDRSVHRFAYGVKNIEELHVRLARWTRDALPAGATAAVHDIGALSFFGRLELLDLEGIASPEMARHKQDGSDRFRALEERRPDYLIVAPDWYPDLDRRREVFTPIHEQQIPPGENVVAAGSSLVVYRAHWPAAGP
jgi:hypothetical protein